MYLLQGPIVICQLLLVECLCWLCQVMGKIFSGLCQCGAWGCFDEFNRIDISVLSVVSTQLTTIKNALTMNAAVFNFENTEIPLDPRVGIFITMNPGYAGQSSVATPSRCVLCRQ